MTEVLPFGSETFWRVVGRFRRDLVTAAAEENIDLIYTYVFAPGDEQHVADIVSPYEKAGGAVSFVQLLAPREVLLQRVLGESRKAHGKPTEARRSAHARRVRRLHGARSSGQPESTSPRPRLATPQTGSSSTSRPANGCPAQGQAAPETDRAALVRDLEGPRMR